MTALNFYNTVARYYEAENETFTEDLMFYEDFAENYGEPILVVGSGTGRVNLYLSQIGHETLGIDLSPEMLALAKRKIASTPSLQAKANLKQGDIFDLDEGKYGLILLPYNALMHFTDTETQIRLLSHLKSLLSEEGAIMIDLPNAGEAFAAEDVGGIVLERTFVEPQSGNLIMQQSVSTIDRAEQMLYVQWIYDEILPDGVVKRTLAPLTLRYIFPYELMLLLRLAGLSEIARYGDYDGGDFFDGCERMIVLAS